MLDVGARARKQQANVRHRSATIGLESRGQSRGHGHLLAKGCQINNLYLSLRGQGQDGALMFFANRSIKGWGNPTSRDDVEAAAVADDLYVQLNAAGIETLYDDRPDQAAGVKFNDADLLGRPVRLVVSPWNLRDGVVKLRGWADALTVPLDGVIGAVRARLDCD